MLIVLWDVKWRVLNPQLSIRLTKQQRKRKQRLKDGRLPQKLSSKNGFLCRFYPRALSEVAMHLFQYDSDL